MTETMQVVVEFAKTAAGVTVAVLIIAALVNTLRWMGFDWPLELGALFERSHSSKPADKSAVNVEYRDKNGRLIELGDFITTTLRNGHGRLYSLSDGVFVGCDPDYIKAGAIVQVSIQGGLIHEELNVMLNLQRRSLFIMSHRSVDEIVDSINRASADAAVKVPAE